jgi:hypothetical protein
MTSREKIELAEKIGQWPVYEQLAFIEELVRGLRKAFTDHKAFAEEMQRMANDPGMQQVLNNEDVIDHATG